MGGGAPLPGHSHAGSVMGARGEVQEEGDSSIKTHTHRPAHRREGGRPRGENTCARVESGERGDKG